MKHLIILLLLPIGVMAQVQEPFKKANTIIIQTEKSAEENFTDFGRHLINEGFSIEDSNRDFLTFETDMMDGAKHNAIYALNVTCIGSDIRIKIDWTLNAAPYKYDKSEWFYHPSKGATVSKVYEHVLPYLESYNANIFYALK